MLNQNRYRFSIKESQKLPSNLNENVDTKINEKDDDFLDISDTELIRASQAVESQLKFTNNVHHATSNAITIFSQFTQNANVDKPQSSTNFLAFKEVDDEIQQEIRQLKSTNMQKDGEVKILRDKLKRLEQEMQKTRGEKIELIKKLQQQQDETKRSFQKQIEFKELENQLKSQEIVELTMKYKVLESSVKKNPNTVVLASTPLVNQKIAQPKSAPLKRSAQSSDTENENPEIKRFSQSNRFSRQSKSIHQAEKSKNFKRSCVLNVNSPELKISNKSNLIYKLTDSIYELSYFLKENNCRKSSKELLQKIKDLSVFLKNLFFSLEKSTNIETIDFICSKLNEELLQLFNLNQINCDSWEQIDIICYLFENMYRLFLIRFDFQTDSNNSKQVDKLKEDFILLIKQFSNITNLNLSANKHFIYYADLSFFNSLLDMLNFVLNTFTFIKIDSTKLGQYLNLIEIFHSNCILNEAENENGDDPCCIFQAIFDKINIFFSETSHFLLQNEKNKNENEYLKNESNQIEIITTIGEETKNSKVDFKLENKISENYLMNSSLSEADDILQSQVDSASPKEKPNIQQVYETVKTHNFQEMAMFDSLKWECYQKLIYFINNYQVIQSIEFRMQKVDGIKNDNEQIVHETSSKKRRIYQSMSNLDYQEKRSFNNTCICFKNILNSFLSSLDYLFGDKDYYYLEQVECNSLKSSIYFLESNYEIESGQNKYLLLMMGLNVLMSMISVDKLAKFVSTDRGKLGFVSSVMDDYKVKNFLSLIKIIESEFIKNNAEKMEIDQIKGNGKQNNLSNSLNFVKSVFKNCMEEYFDFTKN